MRVSAELLHGSSIGLMGDRVARKRQQGYLFLMTRGWIKGGVTRARDRYNQKAGHQAILVIGSQIATTRKWYGTKYKRMLVTCTRYEGTYRIMQGIG